MTRKAVTAFVRGICYLAPHGEKLYFTVPGSTHGYISAQKRSAAIALHIRHWLEDKWVDDVVFVSTDLGIHSETATEAAMKYAATLVGSLSVKGVFLLRDEPIVELESAS